MVMLLILCIGVWANASPVLSMRVNSSRVEHSDQLLLTIEVISDDEQGFLIGKPVAKGATFIEVETEKGAASKGVVHIVRYQVQANVGSYIIYPPSIYISDVETKFNDVLYVDIGVLGPQSELAPILEPPVHQRFSFWFIFGIIFASVVTGWILLRFISSKRRISNETTQVRLQRVLAAEHFEKNSTIALSKCFRLYLQENFFGNFLTLGPKETKDIVLDCSLLSISQRDLVLKILTGLDQIKYTDAELNQKLWEDLKNNIQIFVTTVELE
jgi:hypothetical protein